MAKSMRTPVSCIHQAKSMQAFFFLLQAKILRQMGFLQQPTHSFRLENGTEDLHLHLQ